MLSIWNLLNVQITHKDRIGHLGLFIDSEDKQEIIQMMLISSRKSFNRREKLKDLM